MKAFVIGLSVLFAPLAVIGLLAAFAYHLFLYGWVLAAQMIEDTICD